MGNQGTYWALGAGAAALMLLAAGSKRSDGEVQEAEPGTDTPEGDAEPMAQAGFNPQRFVVDDPEMGRLYCPCRGAIMLGTDERKSVAFRVLLDAAGLAGIENPFGFACDPAHRIAYVSLILAAPPNAGYLTKHLRQGDFRNPQGYGIDLRRAEAVWLPILDLDMLAQGVIQVARYEEDGLPCTELPPEIREVAR